MGPTNMTESELGAAEDDADVADTQRRWTDGADAERELKHAAEFTSGRCSADVRSNAGRSIENV